MRNTKTGSIVEVNLDLKVLGSLDYHIFSKFKKADHAFPFLSLKSYSLVAIYEPRYFKYLTHFNGLSLISMGCSSLIL